MLVGTQRCLVGDVLEMLSSSKTTSWGAITPISAPVGSLEHVHSSIPHISSLVQKTASMLHQPSRSEGCPP